MEVIAEVPNDGDALKLARELSPDVVIMQVQMPFERAKETLQAMRSFPDPPKVVIVTMFESPRYVRGLTGVGASAYLLKTASSEHLVATDKGIVMTRRRLLEAARAQARGEPPPGLEPSAQRVRALSVVAPRDTPLERLMS